VGSDRDEPGSTGELLQLAGLAYYRASDLVKKVLASAREQLGMDVAFVSEVSEGQIAFLSFEGDADSFRFTEGVGSPLITTFCQRVIEGRVPYAVPDVSEDAEVRDLEMTHVSNIGSYVGVPLQFSDGRLFGTVCCMSHSTHPELRERDVGFMGVVAHLIAEHIEREELEAKNRELEIKATGVGAPLAAIEARTATRATTPKSWSGCRWP
jgi:GAF domain-containing protein